GKSSISITDIAKPAPRFGCGFSARRREWLFFAFLADLHLGVLPPAGTGDFLVVDIRRIWRDALRVGAQFIFLDCAPIASPVAVEVGRDLIGVVHSFGCCHRATTGEGMEVRQRILCRSIRQNPVFRNLCDTSEVIEGALAW